MRLGGSALNSIAIDGGFRSLTQQLAATSTGTGQAPVRSVVRTLAYAASVAASKASKLAKTLAATSTSVATYSGFKVFILAFLAAASTTVSVIKAPRKVVLVTSTATYSMARALTRQLAYASTAAATRITSFLRTYMAVASGVPALAKTRWLIFKTSAASAANFGLLGFSTLAASMFNTNHTAFVAAISRVSYVASVARSTLVAEKNRISAMAAKVRSALIG